MNNGTFLQNRLLVKLMNFARAGFLGAILIFFLCPSYLSAQRVNRTPGRHTIRNNHFGLSERDYAQVKEILRSHADGLRKIYDRQNEKVGYSVCSWENEDLWDQLSQNRIALEVDIQASVTKRQQSALRSLYVKLEHAALLLLLNEEVAFWGDELELSQKQFDELHAAVMIDIIRKQSLLNRFLRDGGLRAKLGAVSAQTNHRIENILNPDQRELWHQRREELRQEESLLLVA